MRFAGAQIVCPAKINNYMGVLMYFNVGYSMLKTYVNFETFYKKALHSICNLFL